MKSSVPVELVGPVVDPAPVLGRGGPRDVSVVPVARRVARVSVEGQVGDQAVMDGHRRGNLLGGERSIELVLREKPRIEAEIIQTSAKGIPRDAERGKGLRGESGVTLSLAVQGEESPTYHLDR